MARASDRFPKHGPELRALLAACHREPDDDTPRLVLADWLEEHDDPRGELMRLQVRLAAMPAGDPNYDTLFAQHQKWWAKHGQSLQREASYLLYEPGPHDRGLPTIGDFGSGEEEFSLSDSMPFLGALEQRQQAKLRAFIVDGWPAIAWIAIETYDSSDPGEVQSICAPFEREPWIGSTTPIGIAFDDYFPLRAAVIDRVAQIPNLRGLSFDGPIDTALLPSIAKIKQLEHLHLRNTRLSDRGLSTLAPLKRLRTLVAWGATITNAGAKQLAEFTELRRLHIDLRRPKTTDFQALGTLSKLEDLWLPEANDAAIQKLSGLTRLRRLILGGTQVTGRWLENFPLLTELDLTSTPADDAGLACVTELKRLRRLHLSSADKVSGSITDALFPRLGGLRWLEDIKVYSKAISDKGLVHLESLTNLKDFDFVGEQITENGFKKLRKKLKKR